MHKRAGFRRAVSDAEFQTQVGEAHDTEPNRSSALDGVFDFREWPGAGINNVIQKLRAGVDDVAQVVPVDIAATAVGGVMKLADVDRAKVAGVVGVQELFAARVTRIDRSH